MGKLISYWLIVMGSAISFLLLLTAPAFSMTFAGDPAACGALTQATEDANELKASGVPWDDVFAPWLMEQLQAAKGNPKSFVKDDSDVQYIMESFKHVYENPNSQTDIYVGCMKTPGTSSKKPAKLQVKFAKGSKHPKTPKAPKTT